MPRRQKPKPMPARAASACARALRARVIRGERGATAIEYALIASGIGAAVASRVYGLGSTSNGLDADLSTVLI